LLEIGNALSKSRYRAAAVQLLNAIENDPNIGVVPLTETLYTEAFNLYQNRADKEWGLVDCVSFIVMQGRDISEALTTDEHFRQAGFITLLQN
jgi:predicted nucleic acid-binding protein